MHELGIVLEIFEVVDEIIDEQSLKQVKAVTVEVGELCGIIPDYFQECWNAARMGSDKLGNTELILELKPAIAKCSCGNEYEMQKHSRICPKCNKTDYTIIDGKQFIIKEIMA